MARKIAISLSIATAAFFGSAVGVFAQSSDSATPPAVTASASV